VKTGKKDVNEGNPNGVYPFFTCAAKHTYSDGFSFDCEAILVAGNGAVGQTNYYNGKFEAYQRTYILCDFIDVFPQYLLYVLNGQLMDELSSKVLGNTIPYIKKGMLTDFDVPLPPLETQKKIVEKLDAILAETDKAIVATEANIKNAEALFQSYLTQVFEELNHDWSEKTVQDVSSNITDGKHGDCAGEKDSGYYFLSAKDIKNGVLNYESAREITKHDFEDTHRRTRLEPGDVLVTNSGTIGRMAIAENNDKVNKTTFQKSVAIIKPIKSEVDSKFLFHLLTSKLKHFNNISAGAAQKNLLLRDIRGLKIKLPNRIEEQVKVAVNCDLIRDETLFLKNYYSDKLSNFTLLKKKVLQQAFNGELIKE
jgi:type I restriction enzyme S subunit